MKNIDNWRGMKYMELIAKYRTGFYYDKLDIDEKYLYRIIASAIGSYRSDVDVDCSDEMVHRVMLAIRYDNPEFFYWSMPECRRESGKLQLSYECITNLQSDMAEQCRRVTREDAADLIKTVRDSRSELVTRLCDENNGSGMTQWEVLSSMYEYLVNNVEYAWNELETQEKDNWIYEIWGPLIIGKGVCGGIAQTVNYLCQAVHIPSTLVTGYAALNGERCTHSWNMIKLDGQVYYLDATCEICKFAAEKNNRFSVDDAKYFLRTSKEFDAMDYVWSHEFYGG